MFVYIYTNIILYTFLQFIFVVLIIYIFVYYSFVLFKNISFTDIYFKIGLLFQWNWTGVCLFFSLLHLTYIHVSKTFYSFFCSLDRLYLIVQVCHTVDCHKCLSCIESILYIVYIQLYIWCVWILCCWTSCYESQYSTCFLTF